MKLKYVSLKDVWSLSVTSHHSAKKESVCLTLVQLNYPFLYGWVLTGVCILLCRFFDTNRRTPRGGVSNKQASHWPRPTEALQDLLVKFGAGAIIRGLSADTFTTRRTVPESQRDDYASYSRTRSLSLTWLGCARGISGHVNPIAKSLFVTNSATRRRGSYPCYIL